ncbi:MAG: folate family ECF transporter S component, partial [Clostridia bacterium]|nr:folate family ECF transporter S component [Clostridia bacterium]
FRIPLPKKDTSFSGISLGKFCGKGGFIFKRKNKAKFLSVCAILAAFSIVFGKYLAINIGENFRFSLENLPILLAGLYLGPAAGAVVGAVADLVGCLLVGYSINPFITLGAIAIGFISGLIRNRFHKKSPFCLFLAIAASHLIGSVLIKTTGLSIYYGSPFLPTLIWRTVIYLCTGAVEFFVLLLLSKNQALEKQMNQIRF